MTLELKSTLNNYNNKPTCHDDCTAELTLSIMILNDHLIRRNDALFIMAVGFLSIHAMTIHCFFLDRESGQSALTSIITLPTMIAQSCGQPRTHVGTVAWRKRSRASLAAMRLKSRYLQLRDVGRVVERC